MSPAIPTPGSITPAWLTGVLRANGYPSATVRSFTSEPIGTGQIGKCIRYSLAVDGDARAPHTLVGKFPSDDALSRQTGVDLGNYAREIHFYRALAARLPVRVPRCYYAECAGAGPDFALLLEDMAPATQGDQRVGCAPAVARAALRELVKLHAASWQDAAFRGQPWIAEPTPDGSAQTQALYQAMLPSFLDRYARALADDERAIIARVAESKGPPFVYPPEPWSLVHIDYRLDNLLIDAREEPLRIAVVDWQSITIGSPLSDVAYFLGASLLPEPRREIEPALTREYHADLVALGVCDYDAQRCWEDYRRGAFAGFAVTVIASMLVQQTARGDEMFTAMARRHARHALDLGSAEFL